MKIYPVVHVHTEEQALRLTDQALEADADGVFLIDHLSHYDPDKLTSTYRAVRSAVGRKAFVGVNYLSLDPGEAVGYLQRLLIGADLPDALWDDNAVGHGQDVLAAKQRYEIAGNKLRYFGGVAFKYTPSYTDDPTAAAQLAISNKGKVDVLTTSGPGTGKSAFTDKVAAMKAAIGTQELALASGIDIDNIAGYKPYVDAALVASSIETESYSGEFDLAKLHDLVQAAHQ